MKPKGIYAKWLILLFLAAMVWLWTSGYADIAKKYLDTEALTLAVGEFKITLYAGIKAFLSIFVIFWVTAIIVEFSDKRVSSIRKIRAANRVLVQRILQILIYFIAFLVTLNMLGINLTSLTVLSGALGIGLGFGLQKIASNFVSGLILLFERSLKPNDLIELEDGTFGFVRKSTSRATLIETIDGKEVLVPNEEFIIKQVVNWTLSNSKARVTINFGVSYGADIDKAQKLAIEAAKSHKRCIQEPEVVCFLDNFGDSSVDFIMYFWINDVNEGFRNVKSEVMFNIWHSFKKHGIEIPFPQRDLNIKHPELVKALSDAKK